MEKKPNEGRADNLPPNATEFIRQVVREMGYRKKVRQEVEAELAAHFEDELRGCTETQAREQKALRLIEEFGDAKLLAVLCRRGKKRCRPLWAKAMVRSLQAAGVLVVLLSLYTVWFVHGRPVVRVDYLALWNRTSRPEIAAEDNAWSHYEQAVALVVQPGHELQEMPAFGIPATPRIGTSRSFPRRHGTRLRSGLRRIGARGSTSWLPVPSRTWPCPIRTTGTPWTAGCFISGCRNCLPLTFSPAWVFGGAASIWSRDERPRRWK
jgi:hypothetical protein